MMMPDTTTQRRSLWKSPGKRLFYSALFFISAVLISSPTTLAQGQGENEVAGQVCTGGIEVLSLSDNTNLETEPFTINSDSWQILVNTTGGGEFTSTTISVIDENFAQITSQDFEGNTNGVIDVNQPGTFTLDVYSFEQAYDISVVECGGSAGDLDPEQQRAEQGSQEHNSSEQTSSQKQSVQQTPPTGGPALLPLAGAILLIGTVTSGFFSMRRR